jgi:Flp pilus assembly protein TadD
VRYYVTRGIAPFQSPAAMTALRKALEDPVLTVRVSAYEGLFYVLPQINKDPDPAVAKVREEYRVRRDVVRADDPRDSSNLAFWYFSQGDPVKAEAHLRRGVNLAPRIPRTRGDLVQFLINTGRLDEASQHVAELIKLAPTSHATLLARGLLLVAQKRPDEAIKPLQALVSSGQADETARKALAMARRLAGRAGAPPPGQPPAMPPPAMPPPAMPPAAPLSAPQP